MDIENARTLAMQVGAVIAPRRKQMGLTQVQLATRLGITQDSLSRMENGAIAPKFSRLPELAGPARVRERARRGAEGPRAGGRARRRARLRLRVASGEL